MVITMKLGLIGAAELVLVAHLSLGAKTLPELMTEIVKWAQVVKDAGIEPQRGAADQCMQLHLTVTASLTDGWMLHRIV